MHCGLVCACMCVCVCVCMYVCVCVYIYIHVCVCVYIYTCVCMCVYNVISLCRTRIGFTAPNNIAHKRLLPLNVVNENSICSGLGVMDVPAYDCADDSYSAM
jgi:hypothetical protein